MEKYNFYTKPRKQLKRSGFKQKLTVPLKRSGFKTKIVKVKRILKTPLKKLRKSADNLMTPLMIRLYPKCLLCGQSTQVAHHFIKKSESNRLRYEVINLINLCNSCHCALHNHETIYSGKIVIIKGQDWFTDLLEIKKEYCKVDRFYYEEAIERLANYK